jgi:hypothetical protein
MGSPTGFSRSATRQAGVLPVALARIDLLDLICRIPAIQLRGSSVPFDHITNPYKRIILTHVFQEYCHQNDIPPNSSEYQDARERILTLFQKGHRTVPHLKAALGDTINRAR